VAHHQCYRRKQQESRTVSWDAETNIPEPQIPPMAESIVRETQEGQMLREATEALSPQCRRLIEMLFFETPSRPYAEVAAELGLAPGSIGFTRQKCIDRLRRHLDKLGFR
jgi:RNA polymerase sigma factor (sigma-70 family)